MTRGTYVGFVFLLVDYSLSITPRTNSPLMATWRGVFLRPQTPAFSSTPPAVKNTQEKIRLEGVRKNYTLILARLYPYLIELSLVYL